MAVWVLPLPQLDPASPVLPVAGTCTVCAQSQHASKAATHFVKSSCVPQSVRALCLVNSAEVRLFILALLIATSPGVWLSGSALCSFSGCSRW